MRSRSSTSGGSRSEDTTRQRSAAYLARYNTLCNLQLLTDSENLSKNATPFDDWLKTRDDAFRTRHLIPDLPDYGFDRFIEFSEARAALIEARLKAL